MNKLRSHVVRGFAAALVVFLAANHARAGDIVGNVNDAASRSSLPGAVVTVLGTDRATTTDSSGAYSISGLAAGSYQVQVRFLGMDPKVQAVTVPAEGEVTLNVDLGEAIVQLGEFKVEVYKEGRARALQQKQNQTNISDIIASDAIGNLPDKNVAEAVGRLPGVNVSLEQGEGRYVSIRGVEPNLNQVMIDGAVAAAPGGTRLGRAVPLDTLGAGTVAQLEVVKTVTPDLDANSLGGTLKIKTASPFDRKERFISASSSMNYDEATDRRNAEAKVSFMDKFGAKRTWGLGVTASFDQRDYANHWLQSTWALRNFNGSNVYLPNALEVKPEWGDLTRWGGNLSLEYRPDKNTEFYFRPNYTRTKRQERTFENLLNVDSSPSRTTLTTPTSGTFLASGYRPERRDFFQKKDQELFSLATGMKKVIGDFTLEPMLTFSKADENTPITLSTQWRPSSGVSGPVNFDIGAFDFVRWDVDYNLDVPGNYSLRRTRWDYGLVDEKTATAKIDVTWNTSDRIGRRSFLKAGAKYTQRKRITDLTSNRTVPVGSWRLNNSLVNPGMATYGGRFNSGFLINTDATWAYLLANPSLTTPDPVDAEANSIEDDYDIAEYIYASYLMGSVTFNKLTILGGLRWESTDARIRATEAQFQGSTSLGHIPRSGKTSYDKLFPNLQGVYRFNDHLVFRAAVSRTIGRPAYEDARPLSNFRRDPLGNAALDPVNYPWNGTLSIGNPDLKPFDSQNYDLSLEWYGRRAGVISVAAFRKEIKDPIYSYSETLRNTTYQGYGLESLSLSGKRNGDEGTIDGLEFNVYQPFTFLPSPLDGFGIDANYTKIKSSVTVPTRPGETFAFFRQPQSIANATLFYEKYKFSGRLAWNRSDEQLYSLGSNTLNDIYRVPRQQYDLLLRYKLNEHISFSGAVRNLTREKEQFSYGIKELMRTSRLLGREYKIGLEYVF